MDRESFLQMNTHIRQRAERDVFHRLWLSSFDAVKEKQLVKLKREPEKWQIRYTMRFVVAHVDEMKELTDILYKAENNLITPTEIREYKEKLMNELKSE
jgi:hypothetical protein